VHPLAAAALLLRESDAHERLIAVVRAKRRGLELRGVAGIATPLSLSVAALELGRPLAIITPDVQRARRLQRDLEALSPSLPGAGVAAFVLPALEGDPYALVGPHDNVQRERVATFEALASPADGRLRVLIVPARALLVPAPKPGKAAEPALVLSVGEEVAPAEATEALVRAGYESVDIVSSWGEFSHRGAVLDVFPPDAEAPLRLEYWGDEITEIRTFDPETQRSTGTLTAVRVGAVKEAAPDAAAALRFTEFVRARVKYDIVPSTVQRALESLEDEATFPGFEILRWAVDEGVSPLEHLDDALIACDAPDLVEEEIRGAHAELEAEWSEELRPFLPGPDEVLRPLEDVVNEACRSVHATLPDVAWAQTEGGESVDAGCRAVARYGGDLGRFLKELREHLDLGGSAGLVIASTGRLDRMREILKEVGLAERLAWFDSEDEPRAPLDEVPSGGILLGRGLVESGARIGSLLVQTEADIFGDVPVAPKQRRRRKPKAFAPDLRDLKKGDPIVHADHGIGRFDGVQTMGQGDQSREFLIISYQKGDKLYLPIDRLDLVERYSGVGVVEPKLDRLGGQTWEKVKRSVKKAMIDMTRELLDLYAARRTVQGFRFSEDGDWQREFEGSFPYEETEDQVTAIADVKADMCDEKPMDRLVVGDVGFGKTEVALRAAFKAVMDGKQVAVLTPTTVLSFQHHATFSRRSQAWPVKVELLSRFRTPKQIKETLGRIKKGECDIVVGTHRLLSKDVIFKDLGLLIVDEEQRFGVRHKERMKQLRKSVDVLTLTATPIPRTLSMAMGGLRDMSVIETPPAGRHAIMTHVLPFSTDVAAAAIRQELDRGGQVYFVHDRVQSIYSMANLVRKLVPGARIGVAHGQMGEGQLEKAMVDFLRGEIDVLVSTTVIENGLDIPRANTMLVNRADRHGLSQLYQLRGRVGRSDRQASAYFFVPSKRQLTPDARRRLAALQEFTELGSGFRIAALDLEIRGAGSLLGGEQSGHMAALGFDMYVRLLEETVAELKGEETESGFRATVAVGLDLRLPPDYVEESQRLTVYKRFATVNDPEELEALRHEIADRFGPAPGALNNLTEHARLRLRAERLRIASVESDGRTATLKFAPETKVRPQAIMRLLQERKGAQFSPDGTLSVPLLPGQTAAEGGWDLMRELG